MRQAVRRATRGERGGVGGGGGVTLTCVSIAGRTAPASGTAGLGGCSPNVEVPAASCQYAPGENESEDKPA
jgi:hypothetical protein